MTTHAICRGSLLPILVFVAIATADSSPAGAQEWSGQSADIQISQDDNEYARGVQVITDPFANILHAFWMEDSPTVRELLYGRSTDRGATWSCTAGDRIISLPDGNAAYEEPAAATGYIAPDDVLIVVWSEDFAGTREIHYGISTDEGVTWTSETSEQILSDPASQVDTFVPSVAIDGDGVIHVVWHQSAGETAEIHYSRSTDAGATWSGSTADRVISFPDGNGAADPKIMLGQAGRLIVVWKESADEGGKVLHVGISDDGGDTWTSEAADREISQPVNLMTDIDAAAGVQGVERPLLFAIYAGSFDTSSPFHYETYVTHSADNGETWSAETDTTPVSFDEDHTRSTSNPDVFYSTVVGAVVAWNEAEDIGGTAEIHVSFLRGGEWTGAAADSIVSFPDGENGYRPSITGVSAEIGLPAPRGEDPPDTWILWTEFAGDATDNYEVHASAGRIGLSPGSVGLPQDPAFRFEVWPNPARGPVRMELALETNAELGEVARFDVFDSSGRRVAGHRSAVVDQSASWTWTGSSDHGFLPAGVYFARARIGGADRVRSIVIR